MFGRPLKDVRRGWTAAPSRQFVKHAAPIYCLAAYCFAVWSRSFFMTLTSTRVPVACWAAGTLPMPTT
jgi:hypothetical protein